MTSNGKLLTANISFHRTEKGSTLSDILEVNPGSQYFLSQRSVDSMINHKERHKKKGNGFGVNLLEVLMPTMQKEEDREQC
jgi:hypothetical protein